MSNNSDYIAIFVIISTIIGAILLGSASSIKNDPRKQKDYNNLNIAGGIFMIPIGLTMLYYGTPFLIGMAQ